MIIIFSEFLAFSESLEVSVSDSLSVSVLGSLAAIFSVFLSSIKVSPVFFLVLAQEFKKITIKNNINI